MTQYLRNRPRSPRRLVATLLPVLLASLTIAACDGGGSTPTEPAPLPPPLDAVVQPQCADPAPLLGFFDPRVPGYLVFFRPGFDPTETAADLAARDAFTVTFVYEVAPLGFAANLTPQQVAGIRCEPSVDHVAHDSVIEAF